VFDEQLVVEQDAEDDLALLVGSGTVRTWALARPARESARPGRALRASPGSGADVGAGIEFRPPCPHLFDVHRSTTGTLRPGLGWSTLQAGRCRCSTAASSTSTAPCAPRRGCSTSPTWARSGSPDPGPRRSCKASHPTTSPS